MLRRHRIGVAAGVVALGAAVATVLLVDHDPPHFELDVTSASKHARAACGQMTTFLAHARANARATKTFDDLSAAEREARSAVDQDPHWIRLDSAIMELQGALHNDDAQAASTGIGIARSMCAELKVRF